MAECSPDATAAGRAGGVARPRGRRSWMVIAGTLAVLAVLAGLVLVTEVGAGHRYTTTPDPCRLLSAELVRGVVGDAPPRPAGWNGWWGPLHRGPDMRGCSFPSQLGGGDLTVTIYRYHSAQFGLGPTGADLAAERFERGPGTRECAYQLGDERMTVCGSAGIWLFELRMQVENLYIRIVRSGSNPEEFPDPWPEELLAELTADVLAQLDQM